MSIFVNETPNKTGRSSIDVSASDGSISRSIERHFVVTSDVSYRSVEDVLAAAGDGLPSLNSAHPSISSAVLKRYEGEPVDAENWELTATYRISGDSLTYSSTPWSRKPYNIRGGGTPLARYLGLSYQTGDTQGAPSRPVVNTAGDPFQNIPPVYMIRPWISFSYNLKTFKGEWYKLYCGTMNVRTETILGIPAARRCARIVNMEYAYVEADTPYWQIDMKVEFSDDGFVEKFLNAGFYFIDNGAKYEICHNSQGNWGSAKQLKAISGYIKNDPAWIPRSTTEPMILNAAGGLVSNNGCVSEIKPSNYLSHYFTFEANWGCLSIPKDVY